ncbi:hypothetical protein SDC9_198949 [bioreactor metagenome]|uniref:Ig-like domain-containing protein n=1 Tax=bioreactor metagenome TaxID=1076179 RepID=A0A645IJY6_9ZZZZ
MKKSRLFVYLAVIAVLIAALALMGASCSVSTANVKNAVMTTSVDAEGKPMDSVTSFQVNAPVYAVAELHNAPDDTLITFRWYAAGELVDEVRLNNTLTDQYIQSSVDGIAQPGDYSVEIYIDEREEPDASLQFSVQ